MKADLNTGGSAKPPVPSNISKKVKSMKHIPEEKPSIKAYCHRAPCGADRGDFLPRQEGHNQPITPYFKVVSKPVVYEATTSS